MTDQSAPHDRTPLTHTELIRIARLRAAHAARRARLTPERSAALISAAASHAIDGRLLAPDELAAGAEFLAGRLDVAGYRRWLDV